MAHNPASSDLTGPCEKFFGAITGTTALRAMRRVSLRPQTPKPDIPAGGTLPKYDPSSVVLISLQPQTPKSKMSPKSSLLIPISNGAGKAHPDHGIGEAAELVPIMFVPADEKKKPKVEMAGCPVSIIASEMNMAGQEARAKPNSPAQPEKLTPGPGNPQIGKFVRKTKLEMQIPTSNKAIEQPKFEAAAPPVSLQDKPKPPVELQRNPVLEKGQKEEADKTGHHNIDHRCSAYIDRTMNIIRATSDVGKSYPGADSSNTKMKAKTASNVGGGKSASFKK